MLKQCLQSNRYARQSGENLPKVCPRKRRYLHFDYGKLSICANGLFYFIGSVFCWAIVGYGDEVVSGNSTLRSPVLNERFYLWKHRSFLHDRTRSRGIHSADIWRKFRSFFEHSDCSRRTVWALRASLRQEQSTSGAEKARKSTCLDGGIPLRWAQVMQKTPMFS